MLSDGVITGVSVAHGSATVEEIAAAGEDDERTQVAALRAADGVEEAFALFTCNRAEAYVVTDDPATGRAALAGFAPDVRDGAIDRLGHEESLEHLLRVAAGLESLVLGEDQILGQLRTAYEDARGAGGIGPTLETGVTKAIHVGERVRTETGINEGIVSLGSAAAEVAAEECALADATALVIGAGEMGTLVARALAAREVDSLVVANRTVPHAEHVAEAVAVPASAVALAAAPTVVVDADVVVSTTASDEPLLPTSAFVGAGETVVVDLAKPHDIDPAVGDLDGVTRHDLDTLERVTERTRRRREETAEAVESIVDEELDHLLEQYKRARADEVIAAMYESADRLKAAEIERATASLAADRERPVTDAEREVIEAMADSLVNKLLAAPTKSLREAAAEDDWETIHTALTLFDPEFGGDGPPAGVLEGGPDSMPEELPDELPDGVPDSVRGLLDD